MPVQEQLSAPAKALLLLEGRLGLELAALAFNFGRLLRELPRGRGQPVMVLPGFGMSDRAIAPLLTLLARLGYASHGWGQGRNLGMRRGVKDALAERLRALHARHGPVTLVGWSLGGVFVREMARHQPQLVRRVITLGSPINGHPDANNMVTLFRLANRGQPVKVDLEGFARRIKPPPVPCTAIYTKTDGIVAWRASIEDEADHVENIEVHGSHLGLPFNTDVIRIIVERLA
ncbi:MAG: alpha/beta fold hydrolase [Solimonas sp.]